MKQFKNIIMMLPAHIREAFFYIHFFQHPFKKMEELFFLRKNKKLLNDRNVYKSFKKLIMKTNDSYNFIKSYFECNLEVIKFNDEFNNKDIILICLVKNDIIRIKKFYEHYRNLGIKCFTFIDNDSTDGTFEYLSNLNPISLLRVKDKYTTINRQAWINKVMNMYGYNHTFLIVDSDEFLYYPDCESINITKYLTNKNDNRIRALMLDMYTDKKFLNNDKSLELEFMKKYCYFDKDGYKRVKDIRFDLIIGGVRERVFNKYEPITPYLIKYPIMEYKIGDVFYNSHFSLPYYKNFGHDIYMVLLHYKFLPSDLDKIRIRVQDKNYTMNSIEYRAYLKAYNENPDLKFINSNSVKLTSSKDLFKLEIIKK